MGFLVNVKPNAHVETWQTIEMLQRNRTMPWLKEKSDQEKEKLMEQCRKTSDKMKERYNERRASLLQTAKLALKKVEVLNTLVRLKVMSWITEDQANSGIVLFEDKDKLEIIDAQLQLFKHVILSDRKCPFTFFTKSEKGKKLNYEELFEKLINCIKFSKLPDVISNKTPKPLKPVAERTKLLIDQKKKLQDNIFNCRFDREMIRRNILFLDKVIENPDIFVDCEIKHRIKETPDSEETWCYGKVLEVKKSNNRHTKYVVEYLNDLDNTYVFPLILDLEKKDLFVIRGFDFHISC